MTINSTTRKTALFTGNGATTVFAFTFKVQDSADIVVYMLEDDLETEADTADYTVSLNANQNTNPGGSITFDTAPTTAQAFVITTDADATQSQDIQNQSSFNPAIVMEALDKLTIQAQQLGQWVLRALRLPLTDGGADSLPTAAARAGKILGFDPGTGDPAALDVADVTTALVLGTGQTEQLQAAARDILVSVQAGATAQARLATADGGSAGLPLILEKTAAPTAAPTAFSSGRSLIGAPGGSTYSPVSSSSLIEFTASGSEPTTLTLAANASAQSDYLPVTAVGAAAAGMWVEVINPVASPAVARFFAATIDAVDTVNNRLYLSQKLPWAVVTGGSAPTILLFTAPYANARMDDFVVDGAGLTGADAIGLALYNAKNIRGGKVEGRNLSGSAPWDSAGGSDSRAVSLFRVFGSTFDELKASQSGGYEGGSLNINQTFNTHFNCLYSEAACEDGPLIQNAKGISVGALRSLGARSARSARGFKLESVDGFHIAYACADKPHATGPGFLYGSRGFVSYLEASSPGSIGDITAATVTSNVATLTTNIPHRAAVGDTVVTSGFSDANMNGTFTITSIVGTFLTSTQFTFAVTTSNGSKGGTPVFLNQNPTVWIALGANRLHFGHLRLNGAGRSTGGDGSDIYVTTDDVVVIDLLEADATPTYVGGGVSGTNYIVRGSIIAGVWQPGLLTHLNRLSATNKFPYSTTNGVILEGDITSAARTMLAAVTVSPVTVLTVATLPAGAMGQRSFVSDANATTFASIVAAGGANKVPVYHDGTNWRIG